jgi:hypothetical protein
MKLNMNNWKLLNDLEYKQSWDFISDKLNFKPYQKKDTILLPIPNKHFDISDYYNDGFIDELYDDLHNCALLWFKTIANGERMYALNWQHECYSFEVDLPFEKTEFNEWIIPVFPNGDFLFFLTRDFKNGIFADGINFTICLWGDDMMNALEINTPKMFIR